MLTDAALVAMITDGRQRVDAEAELCTRYGRRVYLYGLRHLRDASASEDFMQDVLSTVIERVRSGAVAEPEKLGAFVLGTCRMQAIGRKRTEARRARILAMYDDPREQESSPTVEPADLARVHDCLERLSNRDRSVLLLSFYAQLDAESLGRELDVSPSHVRVIRHRALGRLQTCVEGKVKEDA